MPINLQKIKGVIFDVDDTLLNNQTELGRLHDLSSYEAVQKIAIKYNLPALLTLTREENIDAFLTAPVHSEEGAMWNILFLKGVVDSPVIDYDNAILRDLVETKDHLHGDVLRRDGRAVEGGVELVHALCTHKHLINSVAIASSATMRDINIFLDELTVLRRFFPTQRVISRESVPRGQSKPHPAAFNLAFQTLGLDEVHRENVLAFEDDPRGVLAAKTAGLKVCAITTRFSADHPQLLAAGPDLIIDSYHDFIASLNLKKELYA